MKHNKGFVFAISILLLLLTLITVHAVINKYFDHQNDIKIDHLEFEQTYYAFDAIEESYKKILALYGLNVSIEDNNATIEVHHTFKFQNYFQSQADHFKYFAERFSPISTSINSQSFSIFDIIIQPIGMTLETVPPKFQYILPNSQNASMLKGYDIEIRSDNTQVPIIKWKRLYDALPTDNNAIYFRIAAQGLNGTSSDTRYIRRDRRNEVELKDDRNFTYMNIVIDDNGELTYHYNPHLEMDIKTKVVLNTSVWVEFKSGTISVYNVYSNKSGTIKYG
ncbi:MAG: hypothetical protein N3E37_00540 [Candidatus Micrarchaeota archaeon]|nr:hypothetical protein [Candidatus Micrarchaeota archaeon]